MTVNRKQVSNKTGVKTTWRGKEYDSIFEADVAKALGDKVVYCGGFYLDNENFFSIKYKGLEGEDRWYVPDFRVVGAATSTFIEAKGNLCRRSRQHLEACIAAGHTVGVCFINEAAAKQGIWPKAPVSKAVWLENRDIPYVFGAKQALTLLEGLLKPLTKQEAA
jgi:hypothetical protein